MPQDSSLPRGRPAEYATALRQRFAAYRQLRFPSQDHLFEPYPDGGPTVFRAEHRDMNILVPPFIPKEQRDAVIHALPVRQRHRHFGSMQSSQALAHSVLGTMAACGLIAKLAHVLSECGRPAFGDDLGRAVVDLEHAVTTLGEPRATSVDVRFDAPRVAVECKLAEVEFGTCSRPRLRPSDARFALDHCDGTYSFQRGRRNRCALTEIGVRYWHYAGTAFGWRPDADHRPCPMASTYQLMRNVLAACVRDDAGLDLGSAHALVLYDSRNPAMSAGGNADRQWHSAIGAATRAGMLRRLSWQGLLAQLPADPVLDWLKAELAAKYGLG